MRKVLFALLLASMSQLLGYSLRLNNNSPHYLQVEILGSDGTSFGKTVIAPNGWNDWGIDYAGMDIPDVTQDDANPNIVNPTLPFTVHWYCSDGETFSVCNNVPNASLVQALSCQGSCQCKTKSVQQGDTIPPPNYGDFSNPPDLPPAPPQDSSSSEQK